MKHSFTRREAWSFVFAIGLLASGECVAQARLLRDIETRPAVTDARVGPLARLGSSLLFEATVFRSGERSLVSWDPVTSQSRTLVPQLESTSPLPRLMLGIPGGRALVTIRDTRPKLAVTDGTVNGTTVLHATASVGYSQLVSFGAGALFVADGPFGSELHVTDGTIAGTTLVKDLAPGSVSSLPDVIGVHDRRRLAVFSAYYDGLHPAVCVTDGTAAGTAILAKVPCDSRAGIAWINPVRFVFAATDGSGLEPWVSDGTAAGTRRLADLNLGSAGSGPRSFFAYGGRVFFRASPSSGIVKLYATDGNTVSEVTTLLDSTFDSFGEPVVFMGRIFFRGGDAAHGAELWVTDGTKAGTVLFADLETGNESSSPSQLTVNGNALYFVATTKAAGNELYVTRGTAQSTIRVADIAAGSDSSAPTSLTPLGQSEIAFVASDPAHGRELWTSDGTTAGTRLHDQYDVANATLGCIGSKLTSIGSRALFIGGVSSATYGLWSTDGTAAGTTRILAPPNNIYSDLAPLGSRALFLMTSRTVSNALWETDGTVLGTKSAQASIQAVQLMPIGNGRALFVTPTSVGVTDGTTAGTTNLFSTAAMTVLRLASPTNEDGKFAFFNDLSLYVSDGTSAGTRKAFDLSALGLTWMNELVAYRKGWFFTASGSNGVEPWFTDGTASGTRVVRDIEPGPASSVARSLCVQDGLVWFAATTGTFGDELWVSDGTTSGTKLVLDAAPGNAGIYPRHLTAVGRDSIYFDAIVPGLGSELCRYDLRSKLMSVAADIQPGLGSSMPSNRVTLSQTPFVVLGNEVLCFADDGVHGSEPYVFKHGAVSTTFGRECGVAALDASTDPHLGASVTLQFAAQSTRSSLHILCLGKPDYDGLPLHAQGCYLHLESTSLVPLNVYSTNSWSQRIAVPAQSSLLDVRVAWQAITFDIAAQRYGSSRAMEWTIGR
ncbi:MAG: hypothetical protein KDC95_05615 [Planctomycetes bacterium]|nr:hypothetical protein [Planctomycetota bacterium]